MASITAPFVSNCIIIIGRINRFIFIQNEGHKMLQFQVRTFHDIEIKHRRLSMFHLYNGRIAQTNTQQQQKVHGKTRKRLCSTAMGFVMDRQTH